MAIPVVVIIPVDLLKIKRAFPAKQSDKLPEFIYLDEL